MNLVGLKNKETFKIIVKPNSSKSELVSYDAEKDVYRINIKARPEDNKANIEVIRFLKKLMKKDVRIISGLKSREKVIRIF